MAFSITMSPNTPNESQKPFPDPVSAFKDLYDQVWKQAVDQWDQVLRNPHFLAMMAATIEQSMNLTARVQELVAATLKTMNIPTRDDFQTVVHRLDALREQIAEVSRKNDHLSTATKPRKRATKKRSRRSR
jgi:hypothetical protein